MKKKSNRHHHHLHILLIISAVLSSAADDSAAIQKLASGFRNAPKGWSSTSTNNYCNWHGISCDKSNRVTSISLASKSVSRILPLEIADLSELRSVSLQLTVRRHPIVRRLIELTKHLSRFQWLHFNHPKCIRRIIKHSNVEFEQKPEAPSMEFPQHIRINDHRRARSLQHQHPRNLARPLLLSCYSAPASYNSLNGTLPPSLSGSMIQNLWINNQNTGYGFTGTLNVLSNMTELTQVWVHVNSFTGPIPDLSKCKSLFDLQVRDNQLTGPVPNSLLKLSSLKNVSLENNKLQGPFPKFDVTVVKAQINGNNNFCNTYGAPCDPQVSMLIEIAGGFKYPVLLSDSWEGNDACQMSFVTCDSQKSVITVNLANKGLSC
ncbi:Leucine-rich repeat protein kinase family protein isoform 2 [Hibiscus syriacus]|uniref:Leucine-rich repeat protein kinase family protein isoform 2 n=1 Tax=Hibiscus syriacus TaxID=106335 RepID=A0A6A3C2M6_HIBSY|nr:receptor-like kinase TMK4 [Hibiscus syriacus]KAE8722567.1 Leucine-rich repeat protein kinase family protein isoform 2 [Hibiscus syriacus]